MQFKYLKYDLYRYFYPREYSPEIGFLAKCKMVILTQGIWAIVVYRFSRWTNVECRWKLLRFLLKPLVLISDLWIQMSTGIEVWATADIGPGFYIGHFGGIQIGPTKIGKFCNVSQGITIGYAGRGDRWGIPELGDFVYVGSGARIIGKIRIGNHVAIGSNSVVTKDVPDGSVVAGVPAKVISQETSSEIVQFHREKNKEILAETR